MCSLTSILPHSGCHWRGLTARIQPNFSGEIARYGQLLAGMPPVLVYRGSDEELMLSDGVTRATRAAKLCPGSLIPAEFARFPPTHGRRICPQSRKLP